MLNSTALKSITTAAILGLTSVSAWADGPVIEITNFVGTISGTQSQSVTVERALPDTVSTRAGRTVIDGGQAINNTNCRNVNGKVSLSIGQKNWGWRGGGYKDLKDYPSLILGVPDNAHIIITNSVIFGDLPDIGSGDLNISSCGDLTVGDVGGPLNARISGSGDLRAGDIAGPSVIKVSGSGDIETGDLIVSEIRVSGSGDVTTGSARTPSVDPLILRVSGSGDIVAEQITGSVDASVSGSGDAKIDTLEGDLIYQGRGSGDLHIDRITAPRMSLRLSGSGDVEIDKGSVDTVLITASGSSVIDADIDARDVTISASGSSDVIIKGATGNREVDARHASEVRIGDTRYSD